MNITSIGSEEQCQDYGMFTRQAIVFHSVTGKLVRCKATIPDTYFSIPATTKAEHGYICSREDGELEFRPHTTQTLSPVEWRKQYKRDCK